MPLCVGIVGNGFIGKALLQLRSENIQVLAYDRDSELCSPVGITLRDLASRCGMIFVSVPTPMDRCAGGRPHLDIVESVVSELQSLAPPETFIVVRSTVPPGTCRRLGVHFMPEFLTEANAQRDFCETRRWMIGVPRGMPREPFRTAMQSLLDAGREQGTLVSSELVCLDSSEAEMIKYFRNTFLATKVAFSNEMCSLCESLGVDYDTVQAIAADDTRIGVSHTQVPGPDGQKGFGGTCFPKDTHALRSVFEDDGVPCPVLRAVLERNETIDRPEQDWLSDEGRAAV